MILAIWIITLIAGLGVVLLNDKRQMKRIDDDYEKEMKRIDELRLMSEVEYILNTPPNEQDEGEF